MKLKGTLPKGESDGLTPLEGRIAKKDSEHVAVMMILDVESTEKLRHTGEIIVKLGIRRVEAILPDDLESATQLIRRAYESRTGETTLPIELEDDLKAAMAGVSLYEPETPKPDVPTGEGQFDLGGEAVRDDVADTAGPVQHDDDPPAESAYWNSTIAELIDQLTARNLDASKGKKPELIWRLIDADDAAERGEVPTNVVNLFQDGSPADDATADDDDEAVAAAAMADEPGESVAETVANDQGLEQDQAADDEPDMSAWNSPWNGETDVRDDV
jgi:hypothetical protein